MEDALCTCLDSELHLCIPFSGLPGNQGSMGEFQLHGCW